MTPVAAYYVFLANEAAQGGARKYETIRTPRPSLFARVRKLGATVRRAVARPVTRPVTRPAVTDWR